MKTEMWFSGKPEGSTYVTLQGATVKASRNLRGLIDYGRVSAVVRVETRKCLDNPHNGEMRVTYANGAKGFAWFRSHPIMIDWCRNRRTWRGASFDHQSVDVGYLTKPGIIEGGVQA